MTAPTDGVGRRRLDVARTDFHPAYVVWELTLRCDLACAHCGSRAGAERDDELSVEEALDVVAQLAEMRTREVVLIGGEAYLHPGFLSITRALAERGIAPTLTTGGKGIDEELARAMREAGMKRVSVSIDGLEAAHDRMRNFRGSYRRALDTLRFCRAVGISVSANTNLNRSNRADLEGLYEVLKDAGIRSWQVQLTTPLGRAADRTRMVLQPYDLVDLLPRIAALKARGFADGIVLYPGNNLGYYGPEEALLRSPRPGESDRFRGCQAGKFVLGIESDGAVKGCPSLQTAHYVGGRLREKPLAAIWDETPELSFARKRTVSDLWGFCRECPFAADCLGGCTFTAHALLGRPGNNPYCHYRARDFQKRGLRERLVPAEAAPGKPFDCGRFDVVVESRDEPDPDASTALEELVRLSKRFSVSGASSRS